MRKHSRTSAPDPRGQTPPRFAAGGRVQAGGRPFPRLAAELERLYRLYNRRDRAANDPVRFVHGLDPPDREVAALIASSLAYGRVGQILASVGRLLGAMPAPAAFLAQSSRARIRKAVGRFRHRFTTAADMAEMLAGVKEALARWGSLERCFAEGMRTGDETIVPALGAFVERIAGRAPRGGFSLLPPPGRGSACKRLNLFLRWMVRSDEVDPGGWGLVPASRLVVPLDTHLHRVGRGLGFTDRKSADLRAAVEVTEAFRRLAPADPVRYDFALAHLGIGGGTAEFLRRAGGGGDERPDPGA